MSSQSSYYEKHAAWVHKRIFKKPGRLIEIGAGFGYSLNAFKKIGYEVSGIDIRYNRAKKIKERGIEVDVLDVEKNKFTQKENSVDYIFSNALIEHLYNDENMLNESYRVLKENGLIFMQTMDFDTNYKNFYGGHCSHQWGHKTPYDKISLVKSLFKAGFREIYADNTRNIPFLWRFSSLAFDIVFKPTANYSTNIFAVGKKISQ